VVVCLFLFIVFIRFQLDHNSGCIQNSAQLFYGSLHDTINSC